jgi:hypothetical protein
MPEIDMDNFLNTGIVCQNFMTSHGKMDAMFAQ